MATVITLKIKDQEGNVRKENHEVEEIDVLQFKQLMKTIKEIMAKVNENEDLKVLFGSLTNGQGLDDEEAGAAAADQDVITKAIASFDMLAVELPDQAFKLLSILSGVELDVMEKQKLKDVMDIYDAVLEENDMDDLINRAKKSLALTQTKFKFKNFMEKVTKTTEKPKTKAAAK
ncbi:hypothetical protein [Priestia megaterium]|uniref:hypothetical protein n=1 Tax=Priestia megaterium TaxID=1404 RepID=UPI002E1B312C|nr:hypothetical protein [Priestia megaterium]